MNHILVVDFTSSKEEIADLLRESGYRVDVSDSAFDALAKLKAFDYALVISEVDLPGDNAFELYNYIFSHYPYIPTIMVSSKEIDSYFDRIFKEGIGNVLCKPVDKNELLNLTRKLITKKNIFGLKNYMEDIEEIKKIRITSSNSIKKSIAKILKQIEDWGFKIENKVVLNLVLNEMIINAVYHSHGYTKEKEDRILITLKKGEHVDVFFGKNKNCYGITIDDYVGKLTKNKILESLHKSIKQSQLLLRAAENGEDVTEEISETGRGIYLLRKVAIDYYFIIKKDARTEVIILFNRNKSASDKVTSLKIIENN
ncbi:MAG: response regulator [Spirochaetes bacterium]|jgi:CheY-like chemotaxis protein|nr:response regulator [Spirochaetota bacterium]